MRTTRRWSSALAFAGAFLLAIAVAPAFADEDAEPTKEAAVQTLKDLLAALEAKDYDKALTILLAPPDAPAEEVKKALPQILERKELSAKGIDILAENGQWGSGEEIFGDKVKHPVEKLKVSASELYGLKLDEADVMFLWDAKEKRFRVLDLDNIGKLEEKAP